MPDRSHPMQPPQPARASYRHGDLRRALVDAGRAAARAGGPGAVTLRDVTRQAGVVPNAAYRHFASRDELLAAVAAAALAAGARAIEAEMAALPPPLTATGRPATARAAVQAHARAQLRAVGVGYLRFAAEEPGLFRTAFGTVRQAEGVDDPEMAGADGLNPFQLLGRSIDGLVDAGLLPPARRSGAEYLAWSAVHGFALLVLDGPLAVLDAAQRRGLALQLVEMVERGL